MAIRIAINHHTQYQYDRSVFLSTHLIRLRPAAHTPASIETYSLTVEPENHVLHWQQDPFGNFLARVDFQGSLQTMAFHVYIQARLEPVNPFDFFVDTYAGSYPFDYDTQLKEDLAPYLEVTEVSPYLTEWLKQVDQTKRGTVDFLGYLNQRVYQDVAYCVRLQPGVQTAEVTLQRAIGSCRDSGWLLVQVLRHLGLAARFVSGYLVQVPVTATKGSTPASTDGDSLALHAWAEVYIPGAGWIGLDPTSGLLATEGHIPLACTPDPAGAAPVTGTTDLCKTTLNYTNTLVRLY